VAAWKGCATTKHRTVEIQSGAVLRRKKLKTRAVVVGPAKNVDRNVDVAAGKGCATGA
jgi:hypothetical protein